MKLLACNVGSTSLKYRLYEFPQEQELLVGKIEKIGSEQAIVSYSYDNTKERRIQPIPDMAAGVALAISVITDSGKVSCMDEVEGIAFKTVHGGPVTESCIADDRIFDILEEYRAVAPLHNRVYGEVMRAFREMLPSCPLVAVFETAFHKDAPEYIKRYSAPYSWMEQYGIQRYGFHGASHRYITNRMTELIGNGDASNLNIISCHLGGSSSICVVKGGISQGTTHGFSPQSGIASGTRIGDFDAYAMLYMLKKGLTPAQLDDMLFNHSGLKGISGVSEDIRELEEAAASGNERAALALDMYCYDVKRYIGQSIAVLGRVDAIVMTGGIGENSVNVRSKVLSDMQQLGIVLDSERNSAGLPEAVITADGSPIPVYVVPTNEEIMVVREAYRVIQQNK